MKEMRCYCGHSCGRCLTYLATVRDDESLREQSQKFYKEEMKISLPLSAFRCLGGHAEDADVFAPCRECPFRKCCRDKGLASCEECGEFPCETLAWYREKYVNKYNQVPSDELDKEKT